MNNPVTEFFDRYFGLITLLAGLGLLVYHFGPITSGLGALTKDTGSFVAALK